MKKSHDLSVLFKRLPESRQLKIKASVGILDFDARLLANARAFEDWRYFTDGAQVADSVFLKQLVKATVEEFKIEFS